MSARKQLLDIFKEQQQTAFSGAVLVFASNVKGKVYFNAGRITWALTNSQTTSFQEILVREHALSPAEVTRNVTRMRNSGVKQLYFLLDCFEGLEESQKIDIVFRHTRAALLSLLQCDRIEEIQVEQRCTEANQPAISFDYLDLLQLVPVKSLQTVLSELMVTHPQFAECIVLDFEAGVYLGHASKHTTEVSQASAILADLLHKAMQCLPLLSDECQPLSHVTLFDGNTCRWLTVHPEETLALYVCAPKEAKLTPEMLQQSAHMVWDSLITFGT